MNTIKIHLPKGDLFSNEIPYGYVSHGNLDNNYPNSPVTPIEKFFKLTMEADNFSSPISLASPNYEGSTQPISSYIRLKYFKQFDSNQLPQESSLTVLRAVDPLDNIFSPFSMKTSFSGTGGYNSIIYENEYFIDLSKRFGLSFIANLAFAEDADNFIYFAYATEILSSRKQLKKRFSFTSKYEGTKNNFLDELTQIKNQKEDISTRKLRKSEFVIGGANIKYLEFKAKTDQLPENFQGPDYDELIVITISKKSESGEDFNLLQIAQNTFLSGYRTYLGIANKIVAADDKNHIYTSADLVLRGFVDDTPNGSIKIQTVLTNLKIYSYGSV